MTLFFVAHLHPHRRKLLVRYLLIRDGEGCCYCHDALDRTTATLEHIIPSSKGGTSNIWNLALACRRCNNERGTDDFFDTLFYSFGLEKKELDYFRGIISNYYYMYRIHGFIAEAKSNRNLLSQEQLKATLMVLGRLLRPLSFGHRLKTCGIGCRVV